jgi:hypothetical protein
MKLILIITLFSLLSSCAKFHKVTVRTNAEGHFVPHYNNINLRPIRDNNFNLITDRKKAQDRLDDLGSFKNLENYTPKLCGFGISESKKYHKAETLLQTDRADEALNLLKDLTKKCKHIAFISHIHYLYAVAYDKKGNKEKAKKHMQLFIHKAESIYPQSFYQFDSPSAQVTSYENYLKQAKSYLSGEDLILKTDEKPRYNTLEGTLLPGMNADDRVKYLWEVGYSTITGGMFGLGYIFKTKYGEIIPLYRTTQRAGIYKSILFRKQLSKSKDRRHTTGITVSIDEWKKLTYQKDYAGRILNVEEVENGYALTLGYGGTYQFNNSFSYVYKGHISSGEKLDTYGTSMISYHTTGPGSLLAGLYNDSSVVMWKVGAIQIWKDFTNGSIGSSLTAGIRF